MKTSLSTRSIALLSVTACLLTVPAFADEWFTPHAWYSFDILSSYISRGKVYEDRPIQSNELDLNLGLSDFGRVGFNHWNYSCLSGKYQDKYRRFMPETDWAVYYEYDWKIAADWKLATQLMTMWKTYYGGKPEDDPTSHDWRLKQTLKNPYITPYYKIHYNYHPVEWWYFQIGLKRGFEVFENFTLTPNFSMDFADAQGRIKRFGKRPDGGSYGGGAVSMIAELTAEYAFTDWLSIHAAVGQFGVVDHEGRDTLSEPHKKDITYGQVGFKLSY